MNIFLLLDLGCNRKLELGLLPMTRRVDYAGERSEVVKYFLGILSTKGQIYNSLFAKQFVLTGKGEGGGSPSYG